MLSVKDPINAHTVPIVFTQPNQELEDSKEALDEKECVNSCDQEISHREKLGPRMLKGTSGATSPNRVILSREKLVTSDEKWYIDIWDITFELIYTWTLLLKTQCI